MEFINMKKAITRRFVPALAGLMVVLFSSSAFAERPEVACDTLDAPTKDHVESDLAMALDNALGEEDDDTALKVASEIMSLCTSDVYVEYTLASLYLGKKDMANACYHFDALLKKSDTARKDNSDIYKALDKKYKKIKDNCAAYREVDITCTMKGVELSITGDGVSLNHQACPFYGYLEPGTYAIKGSRQGFNSANVELVVGDEPATANIPELEDPNAKGHIEVKCPRGSTGFTLTDSKGKTASYTCPYIGDVPADTYTVKLQDSEQEPTTIVVEKKGSVTHEIPAAVSSSCSATPVSGNSAPLFAGAFALLAALGFAVRRRRDAE
jgi:MYXO-CTERM domain-containing protein